jgi:hypothetical protein
MTRGTLPIVASYSIAILKVTPSVVCVGPNISGIYSLVGFSGVTGVARPNASSPIISSSSLK